MIHCRGDIAVTTFGSGDVSYHGNSDAWLLWNSTARGQVKVVEVLSESGLDHPSFDQPQNELGSYFK